MQIALFFFLALLGAPLLAGEVVLVYCGPEIAYSDAVAERFRDEILSNAMSYQTARGPLGRASNLVPLVAPELEAPREAKSTIGQHVISLGSGPDISRVLFNFPFASDIHLVDVMVGWFGGGILAFIELESRLYHLAPNVKVTLEQEGFLEHLGVQDLERWSPSRFSPGQMNSPYHFPTRWRVEWDSPSAGRQVKWVWLHLKDYHSPANVTNILSAIPESGLGAVFVTVARLPRANTLPTFLSRIRPGGLFVADMDFLNNAGRSSTAAEDIFSREMIARAGFFKEHVFPRSEELVEHVTDCCWPNLYFFRKPN